ncbi:hypothetical protein [Streptomyces pseudovenezuelae]|uniref:Uncharacterized protein n=1 Tax=Streptomyces pseudovenezuelae TaxID=67350 RepID=A0ABT6LPZ9_9ACTN|nr:hypothetical protein [Streptomyces pseudovenezuelae]MDH6218390.1 hypothetical protein [Streptomyces pseudovenezuelae]
MSVRRWGTGLGATGVLLATGAWVAWPATDVDARLWAEVRPAIEARLVADSAGTGYEYKDARWFCRAEALDLDEHDGLVRAGVNTLCVEYGTHEGALLECAGAAIPQVVRLKRDPDGTYHVTSRQEPPDGSEYADWLAAHFSLATEPAAAGSLDAGTLQSTARTHFGLPANAPIRDC